MPDGNYRYTRDSMKSSLKILYPQEAFFSAAVFLMIGDSLKCPLQDIFQFHLHLKVKGCEFTGDKIRGYSSKHIPLSYSRFFTHQVFS